MNDVYSTLVDRNTTEFNLQHKEVKMLVLTRKKQDHIHIGDSIVLTVLEVRGNKVRLGLDAPANVRILRAELQNTTAESPADCVPAMV
jgi:carbon storage regulator CsrA